MSAVSQTAARFSQRVMSGVSVCEGRVVLPTDSSIVPMQTRETSMHLGENLPCLSVEDLAKSMDFYRPGALDE
jgi:hypothetical protein